MYIGILMYLDFCLYMYVVVCVCSYASWQRCMQLVVMFDAAMRSNYHSLSHEAMEASDSRLSELRCLCF